MGNCGVGFAPVYPQHRDRLIELMEGVEDIPGTALHEGLPWSWETFPQYLDFLDSLPRDIDLGTQVPHAPMRVHAMGDRAIAREPATPDEIARMAQIAGEAIRAGALGFSSSRHINHKSINGEPVPTLRAETDELLAIARAVGREGGVLQFVSDQLHKQEELDLLERLGRESGTAVSVSVAQFDGRPDMWKDTLDHCEQASRRGVTMRGQVAARAVGLLLGLDVTLNPFMYSPAYKAIKDLPLAERVARMRDPQVRRAIIDGNQVDKKGLLGSRMIDTFDVMFQLGDPPNYEPDPSTSVAAVAQRENRSPLEVVYDWLLVRDGRALIYTPSLNWSGKNLDVVRQMLLSPYAVPGLSDGGAHVGSICDVSFPTTLLQWWGRDRPQGRIPLELLVARQSRSTAMLVGLHDRGLITPGAKADFNLIDFERLQLHAPEVVRDLPAGGRRLIQRAQGYRHTFVNGVEIQANGESTGATPGRLVRGAKVLTAV
jgi:N-acyl-D-aspartate/D-glutamate deacylase